MRRRSWKIIWSTSTATSASAAAARTRSSVRCIDVCGVLRQKRTVADIWIGAHELITHEMPKAFGNVGRIFIDEDPTDAFVFGTNDEP